MTEMTTTMPDGNDAAIVAVGQDVPCFRCGYNVRGLARDGQCPECAAPIDESLRRHAARLAGTPLPLNESDPRWVRTLAWACGLLFAGGLGRVATQALSMMPVGLPRFGVMALYLAPTIILTVGWWMLAAREPTHAAHRHRWLRWFIRAALIVWVLSILAFIYVIIVRAFGALRLPTIVNNVASGLASWACFWRMREIATRCGRTWLRRACTTLAFLTALACLAMILPIAADIQTGPAAYYMIVPEPILAAQTLIVLLPYSLAHVPRFDAGVIGHTAAALVSVAALGTLGLLWRAVRAAVKRSGDGAMRMASS